MADIQETILYLALSLHNQDQAITLDGLRRPLALLSDSVANLEKEVDRLVATGRLVPHRMNEYLLSDLGKREALGIQKVRACEEFSGIIKRASNSAAYLDFCHEVYGYRMPLLDMMDKEQLDYVFNSIPISSQDTVLDLGCGPGYILNHLVEKYGCNGIGIDQVDPPEAVQNGRISYIRGDIDGFTEYDLTPSITLSVDSLYFSSNLPNLIYELNSYHKNRMYLFYSQYIFDPAKKRDELLHADHTSLASALRQNRISYQTIDFSKNEQSLYERALNLLPKYRDKFENEGNSSLYEAKLKDYETGRSLYDQGLASRYLYIVTK